MPNNKLSSCAACLLPTDSESMLGNLSSHHSRSLSDVSSRVSMDLMINPDSDLASRLALESEIDSLRTELQDSKVEARAFDSQNKLLIANVQTLTQHAKKLEQKLQVLEQQKEEAELALQVSESLFNVCTSLRCCN